MKFLIILLIYSIAQILYSTEIKADGCRKSEVDLTYNGNTNITRHGRPCKLWSISKHYQSEQHNYCRTPIGDEDNTGGPWCYYDIFWERCNVPICNGAVCPSLKVNNLETLDKKQIYHYGEVVYLTCKAGYKLIGQAFVTCLQSGQWNEILPRCEDVDECLSNPCLNGGRCNDGVDGYTCTCQDSFMGTNCQYDLSKCDNLTCMNGGICKEVSNVTLCKCKLGYTGEYCQNIPATKIAPQIFLAAKITFEEGSSKRYIPCFAEGIPLPNITWESIDCRSTDY